MDEVTFNQRFALGVGPPASDSFPKEGIVALAHVFEALIEDEHLTFVTLERELKRAARRRRLPQDLAEETSYAVVERLLQELPWDRVYGVCERIYAQLLTPAYWYDDDREPQEMVSLKEARERFQSEVNTILMEENLGYLMKDGRFRRPGHVITERTVAATYQALSLPELSEARKHYTKAVRFFRAMQGADYENSIKEAVAALESAVLALFPDTSKPGDLPGNFQRLSGTEEGQIPPTVAEVAKKLYAVRGATKGVGHGGADGGEVTPELSEFAVNQVGAFIQYLVQHRTRVEAEAPF